MPKVGKGQKAVHYPYSEKGIKDAMAHSKRTGEPVSMEYGHGGMIKPMMPKYRGGGMVKRPMMPGKPMPRPMPPIGPGIGMPKVPLYKNGGKVPSVSNIANRLANLMGYAKGGKVVKPKYKKGKKVK